MRNFNKLRKHEQLNRKPSKTYEQETHRKLSVSNEQTFEKLVNFICNQENEHWKSKEMQFSSASLGSV